MIYSVLLVSGDSICSVTHIYLSIFFFKFLFPFSLLQNIQQRTLCDRENQVLVVYLF